MQGVTPVTLHFRVKFYVTDPSRLHEEYTRYHVYLQVRSTVQYSTVQYNTVQCSTVQYITVQYSCGRW